MNEAVRKDIGRYAAENGNAAALKKFRSDIPDLGESTVRLFKKRYMYLEEVRKVPRGERVKITSYKCGHPLDVHEAPSDDPIVICIRIPLPVLYGHCCMCIIIMCCYVKIT